MSKDAKFVGTNVKISKLSVDEVMAIQAQARDLEKNKDNGGEDNGGLELLKLVIRSATEGGQDLSDEDFGTFPMDELSKLSNEIMKFSGMGVEAGK